jgi:dihydroorotate dehydrogenase electron transfer subunit
MRIVSTAEITANEEVASQIFLLTIFEPLIAQAAMPGQFCMIAAMPHGQTTDPLLKRPLSIHSVHNGVLSFLYRRIGHGTTLLSQRKTGECLELIGPLGQGFDLTNDNYVLVGGGMGIAPILFAAEDLYARNKKTVVVLGARNAAELPERVLRPFEAASHALYLLTEDGSLGKKGLVTDDLAEVLQQQKTDAILACGPLPMLNAVNSLAEEFGVSCQVSLEAHMACGIGACLGCALKARDGGYLHVCKDGPVVNARLVHWDL